MENKASPNLINLNSDQNLNYKLKYEEVREKYMVLKETLQSVDIEENEANKARVTNMEQVLKYIMP